MRKLRSLNMAAAAAPADIAARARRVSRQRGARGGAARRGAAWRAGLTDFAAALARGRARRGLHVQQEEGSRRGRHLSAKAGPAG